MTELAVRRPPGPPDARAVWIALAAILLLLLVPASMLWWKERRAVDGMTDDANAMTNPVPVAAGSTLAPPSGSSAELWSVFRLPVPAAGGGAGLDRPLDGRFRLAGIFQSFVTDPATGKPGKGFPKAILDDTSRKEQKIVGEGDVWDGVTVKSIEGDHATLEKDGKVLTLYLQYGAGGAAGSTNVVTAVPGGTPAGGGASTNRWFAKPAGEENQWTLNRESLMAYYRELLDDPDRIAALYESFKPDYVKGAVAGYRIGVEGERAFIEAVGLREKDVIRSVNALRMTSQSRAEYMIGEFVQNRLGPIVIDLEREGKPLRLIYRAE